MSKFPTGWVQFGGFYSGVTEFKEDYQENYETVNCDFVMINGQVYKFIEDPSDGYRSYMRDPIKAKRSEYSLTRFNLPEPVKLFCSEPENDDFKGEENSYGRWGGYVFSLTEDPSSYVAYWGTNHVDDYYPSCDSYFDPVKLTQAIFNNDLEDICNADE